MSTEAAMGEQTTLDFVTTQSGQSYNDVRHNWSQLFEDMNDIVTNHVSHRWETLQSRFQKGLNMLHHIKTYDGTTTLHILQNLDETFEYISIRDLKPHVRTIMNKKEGGLEENLLHTFKQELLEYRDQCFKGCYQLNDKLVSGMASETSDLQKIIDDPHIRIIQGEQKSESMWYWNHRMNTITSLVDSLQAKVEHNGVEMLSLHDLDTIRYAAEYLVQNRSLNNHAELREQRAENITKLSNMYHAAVKYRDLPEALKPVPPAKQVSKPKFTKNPIKYIKSLVATYN
ncbi:hypothetical protein H8D36_07250 [archaeon]|nr:hypothetical protein [archaeon]MBL7057125.1 hypothetical protein [Candidatus Woesearchaeota archaeon]